MENQRDWECAICLTVPEGAIFQCLEGHWFCANCATQLNNCPQCRWLLGPGRKARNLALENILDKKMFKCGFSEGGCTVSIPRQSISSHQLACPFGVSFKLCQLLGHDCQHELRRRNEMNIFEHLRLHDNAKCVSFTIGREFKLDSFNMILKGISSSKPGWDYRLIKKEQVASAEFMIAWKNEDGVASFICLVNDASKLSNLCLVLKPFVRVRNFGVPVQSNADLERESETLKKMKWQLPVFAALNAEEFLRCAPFRLTMTYLKSLFKSGIEGGLLVLNDVDVVAPKEFCMDFSSKASPSPVFPPNLNFGAVKSPEVTFPGFRF